MATMLKLTLPARVRRAFLHHPQQSGVGYLRHGRTALWIGTRLIAAGVAVSIHAAFPFLFDRSASTCVAELHAFFERMRR